MQLQEGKKKLQKIRFRSSLKKNQNHKSKGLQLL